MIEDAEAYRRPPSSAGSLFAINLGLCLVSSFLKMGRVAEVVVEFGSNRFRGLFDGEAVEKEAWSESLVRNRFGGRTGASFFMEVATGVVFV
ncbi:hypothetical protein NL676_028595 [Syzygium grande]|nr:hypothetical protein NL676_028595 [Syzygium grande]